MFTMFINISVIKGFHFSNLFMKGRRNCTPSKESRHMQQFNVYNVYTVREPRDDPSCVAITLLNLQY